MLIVADKGASADAAAQAAAMAGFRLPDRVDWLGAAARLGRLGAVDAVIVEAQGVGDDLVESVLPHLDSLARTGAARIVIALEDRQIDLVAALVFGARVDLLCAPSIDDRAAGLAATRVALASEHLDEVGRAVGVADRAQPYGAPQPRISAGDIRKTIRARRLRDRHIGEGMFEDPAWDMLLDLYAAELERRQVSVSSLCIAAAVAPTTALRWIARLAQAGLVDRRPDPLDRRRAYIALSETARDRMSRYFAALSQNGLPIA